MQEQFAALQLRSQNLAVEVVRMSIKACPKTIQKGLHSCSHRLAYEASLVRNTLTSQWAQKLRRMAFLYIYAGSNV